jgi:hypothetical protein
MGEVTAVEKQHGKDKDLEKDIEITVNGKEVIVHDKEMTGIQIKQAAVAAGVNIQLDFILFHDLGDGKQVLVKDHDLVKVHKHMRFDAVTNDDNS